MSNGMNFWINFWAVFFFASLAIFAVLAVVVTIGGFFNIRSLFEGLTNRGNQQEGPRFAETQENSGKDDD